MATVTKKDKFFEVLRNIFVGAKIEGNSGYVNLMKIKSKYYNEFKEQLHTDIDAKLKEVGQNFEEELYNKLFTFFKKYFSESGSIYFSYTPLQEKVYERIYRDDKDVMLFWKTHMLYYVKTERLFKNMEVEDEEIIYLFDVTELQHKKSNEKKDLVFDLVKTEHTDKRRIHFSVKYSANGSKNKPDELLKKLKKEKSFGSITLRQVEKVIGIFRRQSEVDYFINKDAKGFLREQFSLWIKGYLLDDGTQFEPARLNQLKALQHIAFNIIDIVSQFEDELVKVFNKPKYSHSSNYVITLDRIGDRDFSLLEKVLKHKGIADQIKEWKALNIVDENFDIKLVIKAKKLEEQFKYLPLDTKYIKELELDILLLFNDLDNQLDGRLIHSENYQALNTLRAKYNEQAQIVYIDPPFNTGSDFDYEDNYQDSSWLSLMSDRIQLSKFLLNKRGSFYFHIDYRANYLGRFLLDSIFGKKHLLNEVIYGYRIQGIKRNAYANKHDTIFIYTKSNPDNNIHVFYPEKEIQIYNKPFIDTQLIEAPIAKITEKDIRLIEECIKEKKALPDKFKDTLFNKYFAETFIRDVWDHDKTKPLISGSSEYLQFQTQKSEGLISRVVLNSSDKGDLVIDYFTGSATTIATAHKLERKWLGIEMGDHFYNVDLPRLKNVLFGTKMGITEKAEWKGGGFFKYFELEQYSETLSKIKYEDKGALPTQDIYHQYLFLKDLKLADDVVKLDEKSKSIKVDLTKLHPAIDIPETLSHLTGKFIKQIKKDEVVFTDGTSIDLTNIDYKIVKPLIWW